jgi:hypothetical protein
MHAKTEFSAHFNPRLSLCFSLGLKMLSLSGSEIIIYLEKLEKRNMAFTAIMIK